ncbi:MAG: tryptophan synthase subunit alpha [Planctomycetota bacterium]|jgi:tryptophan synthase alpha chain
MSRIDDIFNRLRQEGHAALMPFVAAGYPSPEVTAAVIPALERAGASLIEIGFPFSDPIADGPVIAGAMHEALQAGMTPQRVFDLVRSVRGDVRAALVAMVSDSIVARWGARRFVDEAAAAGFDGLIIPDIDTATAAEVSALARERGLGFTLLIAPTTSEARIETIAGLCSGFVYLLARAGLTGEREAAPRIAGRVERIRRHTDLPIAVGFGISSSEHVKAITASADGAIVGSALVRRMGEDADPVRAATDFVADLVRGLAVRSTSP